MSHQICKLLRCYHIHIHLQYPSPIRIQFTHIKCIHTTSFPCSWYSTAPTTYLLECCCMQYSSITLQILPLISDLSNCCKSSKWGMTIYRDCNWPYWFCLTTWLCNRRIYLHNMRHVYICCAPTMPTIEYIIIDEASNFYLWSIAQLVSSPPLPIPWKLLHMPLTCTCHTIFWPSFMTLHFTIERFCFQLQTMFYNSHLIPCNNYTMIFI